MSSDAKETPMVGYVTIGTKDLDRAVAFYDALLAQERRMLAMSPLRDSYKVWSGES